MDDEDQERIIAESIRKLAADLTAKAVDAGQLIEAGFIAYQLQVMPQGASAEQIKEARMAYFTGAQHLWGSVMSVLEPGVVETDLDLRRMELIHSELDAFIEQMKRDFPNWQMWELPPKATRQ